MRVQKRNGELEAVSFDKVLQRIRKASKSLAVNPDALAQQVLARIVNHIKTSELDELAASMSASLSTTHPDWGTLASRIAISNHQKNTEESFSRVVEILSSQLHKTGTSISYVSESLVAAVKEHGAKLDAYMKHERDYEFDYFGFKTLEKSYLLRDTAGRVVERPQHMWMRVAAGIWAPQIGETVAEEAWLPRVFETYDLLSQKFFTHATPTLFNAGTPRPQLSSCYLLAMADDSIAGIYKTLGDCAAISKYAGGIGLHLHNVRARGSLIRGTNGSSNGIVPMLRVFNNTARYVDQGGGKRNGSFAMYLEPWHADVEDFLRMKLNTGSEEERARDLFYALWIPDLFMKRVEQDADWSLFCPDEAPGLADVWGAEFEELYTRYEREGRARKTVSARKLWFQALDSQMETGTPYLLYKDAANAKSNQQNIGTIKSSNLCVAPETLVMMRPKGAASSGTFRRIRSVVDQEVEVWNGNKWSTTTITKTGANQKLLRVVIETAEQPINGGTLTIPSYITQPLYCTEYHKFLLPSPTGSIADCQRVEAKDLVAGMVLQGWNTPENGWVHHRVVSVEFDGRYDDTYCFNEPDNHAGVFNGVLTGNCTEIMEVSTPGETAVCNLASIALPAFVKRRAAYGESTYDFDALRSVVKVAVRNLNRIIDINFYPTPETKKSNMRHRPIGLGVQGLADVFAMLGLAWESEEAADLNQRIFEHIYYAALEESAAGAQVYGAYETFAGSPVSKGILQPQMWDVTPLTEQDKSLDWTTLRAAAAAGVRNSLLVAPMPTASTSQILGYNECFEPFTSNLYTRRTLAGEYIVVNKHLLGELMEAGLWSDAMKQQIVANNGSIQALEQIPVEIRAKYKTSWEIPQKVMIDMAAARGAFICQSQSLNLFMADPNYSKLTSMHFYAWKKGLKTGCYYLRTKAPVAAQKFTVDPRLLAAVQSSTPAAGRNEEENDDLVEDSDSELEDDEAPNVVAKQSPREETRAEKLERLSREYEEEQAKAKAAADAGEGCLLCSS